MPPGRPPCPYFTPVLHACTESCFDFCLGPLGFYLVVSLLFPMRENWKVGSLLNPAWSRRPTCQRRRSRVPVSLSLETQEPQAVQGDAGAVPRRPPVLCQPEPCHPLGGGRGCRSPLAEVTGKHSGLTQLGVPALRGRPHGVTCSSSHRLKTFPSQSFPGMMDPLESSCSCLPSSH